MDINRSNQDGITQIHVLVPRQPGRLGRLFRYAEGGHTQAGGAFHLLGMPALCFRSYACCGYPWRQTLAYRALFRLRRHDRRKGYRVLFSGSDAIHLFDGHDEYLAVSNLTGPRRPHQGLDGLFLVMVR